MGIKMRATAVSVLMYLELVLPGQAHRTRDSEHSEKGRQTACLKVFLQAASSVVTALEGQQ